jgi:predicted RNA polymerase sigma factor
VDDEGFEGWYRTEHPRVIGVLAVISGDRDASIDAADEAFARARPAGALLLSFPA